jgi:hypothetical protein
MSYSFDGLDDTMTGTFSDGPSAPGYNVEPCTMALWFKVANHSFASLDTFLMFGNSSSSVNDSISIRSSSTIDDRMTSYITDSGGVSDTVGLTANTDNTWVPIICTYVSDTNRSIYFQGSSNNDVTSVSVANALLYIRLGETLAAGGDFTGNLAEVAIWDKELDASERASYIAGTAASSIAASDLIGYWPLSASNATQANEGVDAGGDLTVSGAVFDADHPPISSGLAPIRLIWRV